MSSNCWQVSNTLDEQPWQDFVERHPASNIFHTPEMFQVFARAKGHRPTLWATLDKTGYPLALVLPVQIELKGGLLYRFTTRAVVYGGALCASGSEGQAALKLLLTTYQREMRYRPLFTEMRNLTDASDQQAVLAECGFTYEEHLNYLIDLDQSEEALWQQISKSGRKSIRHANDKNVIIEHLTGCQQTVLAYQLLQQVYRHIRVPLADQSLFMAACDVLSPRGMFQVIAAWVDGHCIGVKLILLYKGRIIAWYGGYDRAASAFSPNELLTWHVLKWGRQNGFHVFDFGGAGRPDEDYGPRKFKAKFGGTLVNYGRNVCVHAPLALSISKRAYALMRKF